MERKKLRMVYVPGFLLLCMVVLFLYQFTVLESDLTYLEWESGTQIAPDGTELPYDPGSFELPQDAADSVFRLRTTLPPASEAGHVLIFAATGMELELTLDGETLYTGIAPGRDLALAQIYYTLPTNAGGGTLEMSCRLLGGDGNLIFPPTLSLTDDPSDQEAGFAYANYSGIPAGVSALAFVLVCGLFLLGLSGGRRDWYLLPLALAAAALTFHPLAVSMGYYFLPEGLLDVLVWDGWPEVTLASLLLYLVLGRRKGFLRQLGVAAVWSVGALGCAFLVSLAQGSYLSRYLGTALEELFSSGHYDGLLYWLNQWLVTACAAISSLAVLRAFAAAEAETEALALRERLALESYRAMEQKARETNTLRHEMGHQIAALELLYRQKDFGGLEQELERLKSLQAGLEPIQYSGNFILNAILHDAATRAAAADISFDALAPVPAELSIPVSDLCTLLMNLLDNALEAAAAVPEPAHRFIHIRMAVKADYLAVSCENAYTGALRLDEDGGLRSLKSGPEPHGLGLTQMRAVAKKYHSVLNVSWTETVFTVQTALLLPGSDKKA